jgi:hypothetical protein
MPIFEPDKWNSDRYVKKSHNCYSYAMDTIKPELVEICRKKKIKCRRPQPGLSSKTYPTSTYPKTCEYVERGMLNDNPDIVKISNTLDYENNLLLNNSNINLNSDYYDIALFIRDDKRDYHYYRRDDNKKWSHKNGWRKATNKDNKRRIIKNLKEADRGGYNELCGIYRVPKKSKKNFEIYRGSKSKSKSKSKYNKN